VTGAVFLDELARLSGESVETLGAWSTLGLLAGSDDKGFEPANLERIRLIQFAGRRGIDPNAIADASTSQGDMLGHYVDSVRLTGQHPATSAYSLADAAARAGVDQGLFGRLWAACGLRDEFAANEYDLEAIRCLAAAIQGGMPEEAMLQIARVFADALGKVAEANIRLFHYYVHERLRAEGFTGSELVAATQSMSRPLSLLIEPTITYFHRKAWIRALREDFVVHVAECCPPSTADAPGSVVLTVLFVDLVSFTALTAAMGDSVAAEVVESFSDIVLDSASRWNGRVVKQIGDEFMVVFDDVTDALTCGLEIEARTAEKSMFPAVHLGAHTGPVLYRQADYVGATVNLAARVAGVATPHQFLVTAAVRDKSQDANMNFAPIGHGVLKGISDEVDLFEVAIGARRPDRAVDPVCGMQLDRTDISIRLPPEQREVAFCSVACLQRYVAAPGRYSGSSVSSTARSVPS
jgi:class 3 adenylate cyclase